MEMIENNELKKDELIFFITDLEKASEAHLVFIIFWIFSFRFSQSLITCVKMLYSDSSTAVLCYHTLSKLLRKY